MTPSCLYWYIIIATQLPMFFSLSAVHKSNVDVISRIQKKLDDQDHSQSSASKLFKSKLLQAPPAAHMHEEFYDEYTAVFQMVTSGEAHERRLVTADDIRVLSHNALGSDNHVYEQVLKFLHQKVGFTSYHGGTCPLSAQRCV